MFQDLLGPSNSVSKSGGGAEGAGERDAREQQRLRLADVRGGRGERLLGLANVGTPFEQIRRQPGGYGRRPLLLAHGDAAQDRSGAAADQYRQLVLLRGDQPLHVELDRLDALELRLGLPEVQLPGDAALEAVLGELHGLASRLDRVTRDLEPEVGVAQLEVGPGHVRDQRGTAGAAPLRAQKSAFCASEARRMRPKKSSPTTHRRRRVDRGLGPRPDAVSLRRVDQAAGVEAQKAGRRRRVQLRPEVRLREAVAGARLLDALDGDLQVLVLDERDAHELLQLRVVEELPPRRVGEGLGLGGRDLAPGRRRGDLGPLVVRPERAAGRERRQEDEQQTAGDHE